ncbi:flippase [Candidatus Woesearchaeota archaeon]|nr:flippase [Candidatus Woesearchaeota archaeon]
MANYTKFAVRSLATIFVVTGFAAFLGYIVRLVLARNLSVEEFGLFYAVFAFLASLNLFKSLGFDKSLIKFIPEFYHSNRKDLIKSSMIFVMVMQLLTNLVTIAIVYLLADYLSIHFFHSEKAGFVLKIMAIAFFIDSFVVILKFGFQGFQNMFLFALLDFVRMILVLAIIITGFKLNYGILSPVLAYTIVPAILLLGFGFIFFRYVFPGFWNSRSFIDKKILRQISRYSFFTLATLSGALILQYTDTITLTYFAGLEAVALYNIAFPTSKILMYLPNAIGNLILPLASELWTKKRKDLLKAGLEALYKYSMVIIVPLVFVMFSFSDLIIAVLFGSQYVPAQNAMRVLLVGVIFLTLYSINVYFVSGIGKPEIQTRIFYIAAVFNLIGNIILIPIIGIMGAALTTSASYLIMMTASLIEVRKFIDLHFPVKIWIQTLLMGLFLTISIYYLKRAIVLNVYAEAAIIIIASGMLYLALLFLFKVINTKEIKQLYARIIK